MKHADINHTGVPGVGTAVADILDLPTAETDDTLVLAPDGAGGVEFRAEVGGVGVSVGITFIIDGGGAAISTGIAGDLLVPFACDVLSWTLLADQSGDIELDVWADDLASYPPTSGDSIVATNPPSISSDDHGSAAATDWTSITAGQTLRISVESVSDIERVTLVITVQR